MLKPLAHTFSAVAQRLSTRRVRHANVDRDASSVSSSATHALATEFLTSALLTAVTTSMVSANAGQRQFKVIGPIVDYLPALPETFAGLTGDYDARFFTPTLTKSLAAYYTQLRRALAVTPNDTESWTGSAATRTTDWGKMTTVWQPLCGEARLMLLALCEFDLLTDTDQEPRLLEIAQLIKMARYGGTPCIRSDGIVIVPGWLDGRREVRIPIGATVWIETRHGRQRSVLKDMSLNGMGLSSCPTLAIGNEITVTLPNGTPVQGIVTWCHGGFVGARFAQRMTEADPAYRSALLLSRSAKRDEPGE
jgi:hypothetical protein